MKTKNWCIVLLFLVVVLPGMAQKNGISPYSRFGLGALREGKFVRNFGMAGTGNALKSNLHINPQNPASYHGLTLTSFEAALEADNLWLEGTGQTQYQNSTYFSHLIFGIPVIKGKWGMSFGIMPLTTISYDYESKEELNSTVGSVTNLFEGSGGLNKLLFGHGVKINDAFSVGVNASFLVGKIDNKERIIYNDQGNTYDTRKTEKRTFSDFSLDFGMHYTQPIKEGLELTTGLTFANENDVNSKRTYLVESYTGNIGFERVKDTIESIIDEKGSVRLPNFYGLGFALVKENQWTITLDANYSDWSNATFNSAESFSDAYSVKAAMEVESSDTRKKNGRIRNYQTNYRFGGRYGSSYITLGGDPVQEMAVAVGFSMYGRSKIGSQLTVKGLNFGMEVGTRGDDNGIQVKENFVNFLVGITINDRWFIKRKYD